MDQKRKRARYVATSRPGASTVRLRQMSTGSRPRGNRRSWILSLLIAAALVAAVFGVWKAVTKERGRSALGNVTRIGATVLQNVEAFGDKVLFYDGSTLHCVSYAGSNEWSYQIGTNANYDVGEKKIVAWSGNDIYILNERGRLIYNNKMADAIQFAAAGDEFTAVFCGTADEGIVTVINSSGQTVDKITVSSLTLQDIGFFKASTTGNSGLSELMWMLGINTAGTVISTELQTFQPGRLSIGKKSLGEHLAYRVYDDGSGNLDIVTTREILHYNYRGVEIGHSNLIYGYTLRDMRREGGQNYRLLIPEQQFSGSMSISSVRLMSGNGDRMIHLPGVCMDAMLGKRAVYGFSSDAVYACRFGDTTFRSYAMPIRVTAVLGMMNDNRAVVASGSEIYVAELPL